MTAPLYPKVIFEDNEILVLEKPPGLVVTPSETHHDISLSDILIKDFKINLDRGGVVHRLDKDTSGLLIVAKTQKALDFLKLQFQQRQVKKEYLALVHGFIKEPGKIEGAIERNPGNREKFAVLEEGREAVTEYEPIQRLAFSEERLVEVFEGFSKIQFRKLYAIRYPDYTLLKCFPLTGRTHQIRVHLKYIGFPIVGDEKYVGRKVSRLDKRWAPRQFLHAIKIEFFHPKDGRKMSFESKLPEDLEEVLGKLEAYG